jgi:hypothetical protein
VIVVGWSPRELLEGLRADRLRRRYPLTFALLDAWTVGAAFGSLEA